MRRTGKRKGETNFVAVEREEEFERVGVEDFDRRIQQRYGQESSVRTVFDSKYVVGHLERFRMRHRQNSRLLLLSSSSLLLAISIDVDGSSESGTDLLDFEIPEFDIFVGASGDESSTVGSDVE